MTIYKRPKKQKKIQNRSQFLSLLQLHHHYRYSYTSIIATTIPLLPSQPHRHRTTLLSPSCHIATLPPPLPPKPPPSNLGVGMSRVGSGLSQTQNRSDHPQFQIFRPKIDPIIRKNRIEPFGSVLRFFGSFGIGLSRVDPIHLKFW